MSSLEYFDRISSLGPSAKMLSIVLVADILFSAIHICQEWKGEKYPLYRAFGAVVGFWFPREIGFAIFTVMLAILLWVIGIVAYTGLLGVGVGIGALGFILGARIGDSILSHWRLHLIGYRPNPGLSSTVLYVLEALLIGFCFMRGLALDPIAAWTGVVLGFVFFLIVLPSMALLRRLIRPFQRELWARGKQIPEWAITT